MTDSTLTALTFISSIASLGAGFMFILNSLIRKAEGFFSYRIVEITLGIGLILTGIALSLC